jgi:hypothetical protein
MIETLLLINFLVAAGVLAWGVLLWDGRQKAYEKGRALGRAQSIKDMADSQSRLADALAAKNERLERIIAKGRESKSGSAQHLARIAAGDA